jgi:hypothetical protein
MTSLRSRPARVHLQSWRDREWTPVERATLIVSVAICLACLFMTTYSLALADPIPHHIDAGLIGGPASSPATVRAVEAVARDSVAFHRYPSTAAAGHAMASQKTYATLDLTSPTPTLYVSSAAGTSVARVLEHVYAVDRSIRVIDAHPLIPADPNGINLFYLMLVATLVGFVGVFQVRVHAGGLTLRHQIALIVSLAVAASFALVLVDAALLHRLAAHDVEEWAILAVHLCAVSSFTLLMVTLIGPWAIVPTWAFFVILGNTSSGGAVAPPLLPQPFAFLSSWLPSGATVTALRNAVYFRDDQHARPLIVLLVWAIALFLAWTLIARRREARMTAS